MSPVAGRRRGLPALLPALLPTLLLAAAGLAHGAPSGSLCSQGGCAAAGVDPALIREAARAGGRDPAAASSARLAPPAAGKAATAWERQLGGPGAQEAYDCALSFGVGGTLGHTAGGGEGFLATRILGQTRVLRGGDGRQQ
jgi:hypothetical protein